MIKIDNSGHVKITYQKTTIQIIGFMLELISFIIVITYVVVKFFKYRDVNYVK